MNNSAKKMMTASVSEGDWQIFKQICNASRVSVSEAIRQLITMVIDDKIVFTHPRVKAELKNEENNKNQNNDA